MAVAAMTREKFPNTRKTHVVGERNLLSAPNETSRARSVMCDVPPQLPSLWRTQRVHGYPKNVNISCLRKQ